MRPGVEKAYSTAYDVLKKYNVYKAPVDVDYIAESVGAVVVRHKFNGSESGFALRNGQQRVIGVNARTSRRRQRFTIAHEIGHLLLHEGTRLIVDHSIRIDRRDEVSSIGSDNQEIEANAFGAALLMPHDFIVDHVNEFVGRAVDSEVVLSRDHLIAELARDFDVSTEAMGFRLINLGILAA